MVECTWAASPSSRNVGGPCPPCRFTTTPFTLTPADQHAPCQPGGVDHAHAKRPRLNHAHRHHAMLPHPGHNPIEMNPQGGDADRHQLGLPPHSPVTVHLWPCWSEFRRWSSAWLLHGIQLMAHFPCAPVAAEARCGGLPRPALVGDTAEQAPLPLERLSFCCLRMDHPKAELSSSKPGRPTNATLGGKHHWKFHCATGGEEAGRRDPRLRVSRSSPFGLTALAIQVVTRPCGWAGSTSSASRDLQPGTVAIGPGTSAAIRLGDRFCGGSAR